MCALATYLRGLRWCLEYPPEEKCRNVVFPINFSRLATDADIFGQNWDKFVHFPSLHILLLEVCDSPSILDAHSNHRSPCYSVQQAPPAVGPLEIGNELDEVTDDGT